MFRGGAIRVTRDSQPPRAHLPLFALREGRHLARVREVVATPARFQEIARVSLLLDGSIVGDAVGHAVGVESERERERAGERLEGGPVCGGGGSLTTTKKKREIRMYEVPRGTWLGIMGFDS